MDTVDVEAPDFSNTTITMHVRLPRLFRVRFAIARSLLLLGAAVLGARGRVECGDTPEAERPVNSAGHRAPPESEDPGRSIPAS